MSLLWRAKHTLLALSVITACAGSAHAAAPDISGKWTFTFIDDPKLVAGATQCVVLTKTGTVDGVANSGTWTSTTYPTWGGYYVIDKKNVLTIWGPYGSPVLGYTSAVATVSNLGVVAGRSYMEIDPTGQQFGTGSMALTHGCVAGAVVQSPAGVSPSGAKLVQ